MWPPRLVVDQTNYFYKTEQKPKSKSETRPAPLHPCPKPTAHLPTTQIEEANAPDSDVTTRWQCGKYRATPEFSIGVAEGDFPAGFRAQEKTQTQEQRATLKRRNLQQSEDQRSGALAGEGQSKGLRRSEQPGLQSLKVSPVTGVFQKQSHSTDLVKNRRVMSLSLLLLFAPPWRHRDWNLDHTATQEGFHRYLTGTPKNYTKQGATTYRKQTGTVTRINFITSILLLKVEQVE